MTWDEVCADPCLQDLPYKIETNRFGQIIMSPARNQHSRYQSKAMLTLNGLMTSGEVSVEFTVETSVGVKVPDVVWMSPEFITGLERVRPDAGGGHRGFLWLPHPPRDAGESPAFL